MQVLVWIERERERERAIKRYTTRGIYKKGKKVGFICNLGEIHELQRGPTFVFLPRGPFWRQISVGEI